MSSPLVLAHRIAGGFYWFIVLTFATLEPWGNIDTRSFSYMGATKFWEYNAFIISQMLTMLVLGFILWRNTAGKKTMVWGISVNMLFISMNAFDIVHFFPDPAQSMPFMVLLIEVVNSIIAFGLIWYFQRQLQVNSIATV